MIECFRIAQPGGIVAMSTWKSMTWMEYVQEAITRVDGAPPLSSYPGLLHMSGDWDNTDWIADQLKQLGATDIQVESFNFGVTLPTVKTLMDGFRPVFPQVLFGYKQEDKDKYAIPVADKMEEILNEKYDDKPFEMRLNAIIAVAKKSQ